MGTRKRYGVAVAGIGYVGMKHVAAVQRHARARLVGVVSDNLDDTRRVAEQCGVAGVEHYEELLALPGVDLVIVATPNEQHAEHVLAALKAGKHVLCEKPMVTTQRDCQRVVTAAAKSGCQMLVGQVCRFSPYFNLAKQAMTKGQLGQPIFAEGAYIHRISRAKSWWSDHGKPGSMATLGGGCHPIDLLRWVVGDIQEIRSASSSGQIWGKAGFQDCVTADFVFVNGCLGRLLVSLGAVRPYSIDLSVYGAKGTLINDRIFLDSFAGRKDFKRIPVNYQPEHPYFYEELDNLIQAIEGRCPLVSAADGAGTVMTCLAIIEAIRSGRSVEVDMNRRNDEVH